MRANQAPTGPDLRAHDLARMILPDPSQPRRDVWHLATMLDRYPHYYCAHERGECVVRAAHVHADGRAWYDEPWASNLIVYAWIAFLVAVGHFGMGLP